ncbi:MAG: carbohydrate-binding family 9-like protein [Bacteroidota bacterium]|nr:carbohydrate-binding family 9-like protein [Bacteroidota bacterium]
MKKLTIKHLKTTSATPMEEISSLLDKLGMGTPINTVNWDGYNYQPEVKFNIGYSDEEIYIKYYVTEDYVMAQKSKPNQSVCQDSCVEFFVTPVSDGPYYNFEFNPIGTCLLGKGNGRHDSTVQNPELIKRIRRLSSVGTEPFDEKKGKQSWTLCVAIPLDILFGSPLPELSGKIIRANFYKCGDSLSEMHYLTWNPVGTDNPDFHQPEYFGVLEFE